ncbi:MAG: hypothetical protein Q9219_006308 [cf. Caloplaca sp. 3 TL-2023]
MSYHPPVGGQPPSFKTNVNRAKTKRWVEAKSYSYDGDDWGEMDEYDEYGGYDESPPPPKPTGFRQRGQSANREQQGFYQPQPGSYNNPEVSQRGYGNIGRQGPVQQQYGARSATNPPSQIQLTRSGSFDQGDERRAFSATFPQSAAPPPQSEMYQPGQYTQADYGNRDEWSAVQAPSNQPVPAQASSSEFPHRPDAGDRTQSMTSNSSLEFHNRRDFSPSAVPPPLHTRGSPSPQSRSDQQSAWRPPRKSSLSQQHNQPEQMHDGHDFTTHSVPDTRDREPTSRERTASDVGKPLPFVRPADIYRRMQEEKEKERQSQDSSRPSMDAIMDERETAGGRGRDRGQDFEPRNRSRSTLDPVAERKSEYGMSGVQPPVLDLGGDVQHQQPPTKEDSKPSEASKAKSTLSPQLPDVARMSGFGELFAGATQSARESSESVSSQRPPHEPLRDASDNNLQHQPSLGFRSIVNQAFDTTHEQIPATPSSNADSSIGRSGSGGTSVVSPIISRGSSSATPMPNFREPHVRPATPPAVIEDPDMEDRPQSSDSLGTPKALVGKASPDPMNQRPANFKPGHRRDLSTPSPDNSPARTPAMEANKQLQQPQTAELATTTPITTHFPHNNGPSESAQNNQYSPIKLQESTRFPAPDLTKAGSSGKNPASPAKSLSGETPKSPAESTKSRVRDLADKFESGRSSPAGSERAPSPIKTSFLPGQATNQSRPLPADRLESFRPKLPGGWESSASLAPLSALDKPEISASAIPLEQRLQSHATQSDRPKAALTGYPGSRGESFRKEESTSSPKRDEAPPSDPFASLAAAGNALVGAFTTTVGYDEDRKYKHPSRHPEIQTSRQSDSTDLKEGTGMTRPRNASVNTAFLPEASKPAMLTTPDNGVSSIMPTPLDKLQQPTHSGPSRTTDYFGTTSVTPKQQASGDSYTTQNSASTKRSQLLPTLSTDTAPQYESDRLRREIIRELSPRLGDESNTAESDSLTPGDFRQSANPSLDLQQRESLVIPREYDSYWNDSGSEKSSRAPSVKGPSNAVREAMLSSGQGQSSTSPAVDSANKSPRSQGESQPIQGELAERPVMPPHRFSWEGPNEALPTKQEPLSSEPPLSDYEVHQAIPHGSQGPLWSNTNANAASQPSQEPYAGVSSHDLSRSSASPRNSFIMSPPAQIPRSELVDMAHRTDSDHGPATGQIKHDDLPASPRAVSASPVTGSRSPRNEASFAHENAEERNEDRTQPVSAKDELASRPGPPAAPPNIQNFREILALKDPQDRIKAYNKAREQIASVDTGLAYWLAATTADLPEHKDVLPNGKFMGVANPKSSTTRNKLGALLPGSSSTQQPYYQQYLNASSPAGAAADASNAPGSNSPQAYSPSSGGGKLTGQQMQARGKDLLHSAGVFGGKANVAAKGLFSKGKSKFRGGNADKAPISTFNINHQRDSQHHHQLQPSQDTRGTPSDGSPIEVSSPTKESAGSRPSSSAAPSARQTQDPSGPEMPNQSRPMLGPSDHQSSGDMYNSRLSGDLGRAGSPRPPFLNSIPSTQGGAETSSAGNAAKTDSPRGTGLANDQKHQGQQQADQARDVQSPQSLAGSNRTPTQADYMDYFRRGSSSAAIIPKGRAIGTDQRAPEGEPAHEPSLQSQRMLSNSPPTLESKYSLRAPQESPSNDAGQTDLDPRYGQTDQTAPQRGSEDSDGTFQTAESGPRTHSAQVSTESHRGTLDPHDTKLAERPMSETSSEVSPSSTPPVAVPAANMQDHTRTRPFSFVQFSKSPTLQPFEDFSHREPSIDSAASRIDTDQDVPPSPLSSRQSDRPSQLDQPEGNGPSRHGVNHDFNPATGQHLPGTGPNLPLQAPLGSNLKEQPTFYGRQRPLQGDETPVPNKAPSIPYPETVHPHRNSTEYSLEGVGPPPVPRPRKSTSASKRGSRSSAFFKSFKTPPVETTSPQLSNEGDDTGSQEQSKIRKSKSKRGSLFRSLTGAAKDGSNEGNLGEEGNKATHPAAVPRGSQPTGDIREKQESPSKPANKYRNRLSRAATAKLEEQQQPEPIKKKRFSAIGSLFGRSKDQKSSPAGIDRPQQVPEQAQRHDSGQSESRGSRISTSTKPTHEAAIPPANGFGPDDSYHYTRNKLAREGLLAQKSLQRSSNTSEPSAYSQDSAQRQQQQQRQQFPPRQQSLDQSHQQNEQRPSGWSREQSSSSYNARPQQNTAPPQQQRVQSSVTTRSTTRHSGVKQQESQPRQLSSMTTTTTTTTSSRNPRTDTRYQTLGNSFQRSGSPPPPAPPPKDNWHHSRSHERSISSNSFAQNGRTTSSTVPSQTIMMVNNSSDLRAPPAQQAFGKSNNFPSPNSNNYSNDFKPTNPNPSINNNIQTRQSLLPPLQTNVPSPSLPTTNPQPVPPSHDASSTASAPNNHHRRHRQSQIEQNSVTGTPRTTPGSAGEKEVVAATNGDGRGKKEEEGEEEKIVMSATSFPGQEWQPSGFYEGWEGE